MLTLSRYRLTILFLFSLLAVPAFGAPKTGPITALPKWIATPAAVPPTTRKDPVVVRLAETQVQLGSKTLHFFNRAIQVNDRSALARIGQFGIEYIPEYQSLQLHRVSVIRDGQVLDRAKDVGIRHLQRETGMEAGTYIGAETVQLLLSDVRPGDTLWISYSIEGSNPVFGNVMNDSYSWDGVEPVELRRLSIAYPSARKLAWRQLGDFRRDPIAPLQEERNGLRVLRFEGKGLEPVPMESALPSDYLPIQLIELSEYASWQSVSTWAQTLFPKTRPGPALSALARQFQSESSAAARTTAALHWVQREVRYFSVSMGENSHRPRAPEEVLKRRYGDCKDKSYLLVSLLGAMGIDAYPVLVSARAPRLPAKVLPGATWFDHVVVRVQLGAETYYVDPTRSGQVSPLARLPAVLPGGFGLPVDAGSKELVKLPEPVAQEPAYEHRETVSVAAMDGDASMALRMVYRMGFAEWAREHYAGMSETERHKALLALYEKQHQGVAIVGKVELLDDAARNQYEVVANYHLPKPVTLQDQKYSLAFKTQIVMGSIDIPDKLVRNYPFALSNGEAWTRYRLAVNWPVQLRSALMSDVTTLDNPFFHLEEEHAQRGNRVDYLMDYRFKQREVAPADMPALYANVRKLEGMLGGNFNVGASDLRSASQRGLPFLLLEGGEAAVHIKKRFGGSEGDKASQVLNQDDCNLLLAAVALESRSLVRYDQLLANLRSRYEAGRAGAPERQCYGRLLLGLGEFSKARAALGSQQAGADEVEALRASAWTYLYAGDAASAASAIDRYAQTSKAPRRMVQAERIALYQRAGRALPDGWQQDAAAFPDGPWPRPILAMQAGVLSQDALLKTVAAMNPDAAEQALPEAWYFIGHKLAADGQRAEARNAFQRSVAASMKTDSGIWLAQAALLFIVPASELTSQGLEKDATLQTWEAPAAAGSAAAQRNLGLLHMRSDTKGRDESLAQRWLLAAAQQDDAPAQIALGLLLQQRAGRDGKPDPQSVHWMQRSADLGHARAPYFLAGVLARQGPAQAQAARAALLLAAKRGYAAAQNQIGWQLMNGEGVPVDRDAAMIWFSLAAAQGDVEGAANLGYCFEYGFGVKKSLQEAFKAYQWAAQQGSAYAQVNLGLMYLNGRGVQSDHAEAIKLFRKAMAQNDARGQYELAFMYDHGLGVRRDPQEALRLYLELADAGNRFAQFSLGEKYRSATGVEADNVKAIAWYKKAAAGGHVEAHFHLGEMYEDGRGVARDRMEAFNWYLKAADLGSTEGQNTVGIAYEAGDPVPADLERALGYFRKAAEAGDSNAQCNLARVLADPKKGRLDRAQAYRWWQLVVLAPRSTSFADKNARIGLAALEPVMTAEELAKGKALLAGR